MSLREDIMLEVGVTERGLGTPVEADFLYIDEAKVTQFWLVIASDNVQAQTVCTATWTDGYTDEEVMTEVDQILDAAVTKYCAAESHTFSDPGPAGVIKRDWEVTQRDLNTWCVGPASGPSIVMAASEAEATQIADDHNAAV